MRSFPFILVLAGVFLSTSGRCQNIEKVFFAKEDTLNDYYLAVRPFSTINGALVLLNSFSTPEKMLPETKLHNVAYANDLLTIAVSMKEKLYADSTSIARLNAILKHVVSTYSVDTSTFALAGYDFAGNIALRYAELTQEHPGNFLVHPKVVIAIDSPVDLFSLWRWSERQIKRNSRSMGDARYIIDLMTKENGTIYNRKEQYNYLTPFNKDLETTGNEQYLKNIPVRLYYDVDVEWQLKSRQNSLYDTNIPEGSELISRLLNIGNKNAELITAKQPGMNSMGIRTTNSLSIVDEVDCIHWIKNKLNIFDANTWKPPYNLFTPEGWEEERFPIPIDFAPQINYKGIEDIRFAPGWGNEKSEQYWSYAYLWWLEGDQIINAASLHKNLTDYYQGLVARNIISRKIPANKVRATNVILKPVKTDQDGFQTFRGTIMMLDYMSQQPITLNCIVHVTHCKTLQHTGVFIEISPKPYLHTIWKDLNSIEESFKCN